MRLSIRGYEGTDQSISFDTSAVVLLVHNTRGQYVFMRGPVDAVYPLFMYGYKNWPSFTPFEKNTIQRIDRVFHGIEVPTGEDIVRISPEILTGEYKTPSRFIRS